MSAVRDSASWLVRRLSRPSRSMHFSIRDEQPEDALKNILWARDPKRIRQQGYPAGASAQERVYWANLSSRNLVERKTALIL